METQRASHVPTSLASRVVQPPPASQLLHSPSGPRRTTAPRSCTSTYRHRVTISANSAVAVAPRDTTVDATATTTLSTDIATDASQSQILQTQHAADLVKSHHQIEQNLRSTWQHCHTVCFARILISSPAPNRALNPISSPIDHTIIKTIVQFCFVSFRMTGVQRSMPLSLAYMCINVLSEESFFNLNSIL